VHQINHHVKLQNKLRDIYIKLFVHCFILIDRLVFSINFSRISAISWQVLFRHLTM